MRHCFERRESKRFAAFGKGWINEEPGALKLVSQLRRIENRRDEIDLRVFGEATKRTEIIFAATAKPCFGRSYDHELPFAISSARSLRERFNQEMHPFFRMQPTNVKSNLLALGNQCWRGLHRSRHGIWHHAYVTRELRRFCRNCPRNG